jgi:exopolysaccharide production protein ExoZ
MLCEPERVLLDGAKESKSLIEVQVLRAIAAAWVAITHAQHDAIDLAVQTGHTFQAWNPIPWNAGVDVFFVISGLIMVHSSHQLFGKQGSARLFLMRRIARIVPLYWIATTLYVTIALLAPALVNQNYMNSLFVAASYLFIPLARPNGVIQPVYELGWTLNYEMFFYGLFAIAMFLPLRWAGLALLATLGALVAAGQFAAPIPATIAFWTDPILLEFGFGVLIGLMCTWRIQLGAFARASLATVGIAALILAAAHPDTTRLLPRPLVYGLPAALIVAGAAFRSNGDMPKSTLVWWGAMAGDASYALYLFHPFVIRAMRVIVWRSGLAAYLGSFAFVVVALAACLGISLLIYRNVERPLTQSVRHLLRAGGKKGRPAVYKSVSPSGLPAPPI